jgi:hypothetical protein
VRARRVPPAAGRPPRPCRLLHSATPGLLVPSDLCRIKEESEIIEGEVVEVEIDRPAAGQVAKMVRASWAPPRRPDPPASSHANCPPRTRPH